MQIDYVRVSTNDQNTALQGDALERAGCEQIFEEKLSNLHSEDYLFQSRIGSCQHILTRQTVPSWMDRKAWSRRFAVQHTFHEKNKTLPDIQKDQESQGHPNSVWS